MLYPALVSPEEEMPQILWKHIPLAFLFQKSEIRQFIPYDGFFFEPKSRDEKVSSTKCRCVF